MYGLLHTTDGSHNKCISKNLYFSSKNLRVKKTKTKHCFVQLQVKTWITINEPFIVSNLGYGNGYDAPGRMNPGVDNYIVAHNLLKAHAHAYRLYQTSYNTGMITLQTLHLTEKQSP